MFDHEVDEDRPEVCTFGVAGQDFVKHGVTPLHVTITKLQLRELANHIHTWEGARQNKKIQICEDTQLEKGNRTWALMLTVQLKGWEMAAFSQQWVYGQIKTNIH